jgi:hypothetical protein
MSDITADEVLLGFDARRGRLDDADERWDQDRRRSFLLRTDVPRPLSVDELVWPSVFDSRQGASLSEAERHRLDLHGLQTPDWVGANTGLWDDLNRMKDVLDAAGVGSADYTLLAVTWLSLFGFRDGGDVGPYVEPTEPDRLSPDWIPLGLDIADGSCLSSLTDCADPLEDRDALQTEWSRKLNSYHLFDDTSDAFEYAEQSNSRFPTHAPFFVFALYRIRAG